jgi:WD40 repeat protein
MPDSALLSASIQYGLVARSFPFTDKVLDGYLNSTGVPPGLTYENPGTELVPDLTVCILASDGATAKIIWGKRDGSVSIVSHPRTMSGTRAPHTSSGDQEHEDAVLDGTWAANGDAFVTAGADGRVKVWNTKPLRCAWTSERHLRGPETDAIVRVVEDLDDGLVVAASGSGDIIVLSGFDMSLDPIDTPQPNILKFCISAHELSKADVGLTQTQQSVDILTLLPQVTSPTRLSVLVCRVDSTHFYRCTVDLRSKQVTAKVFGNPAFGLIRCIHPAFSNDPAEPGFVIAGTQLGFISIYDWDSASPSSDTLLESRHADVFDNSHVTSLAVNSFVIAAGSAHGAIRILDLLTLETLRSITAPMKSDVGQIELIGEAFVASVGGRVLAWSSGQLVPGSKDTLKTKGKGKQQSRVKWSSKFLKATLDIPTSSHFAEQLEIRDEIADAKNRLAKESQSYRRSFGPEHEQSKKLQTLGLSERDAVEYALMLSRVEEQQRVQRRTENVDEQEVIEANENSRRQSGSEPFPLISSSSDRYSPPTLSRRSSSGTGSNSCRLLVPLAPPTSNVKVQVSPRSHSEPKKAGGLLDSPSDSQSPRSVPHSQFKPGPTSFRATSSKQASTRDHTSSPTKQNAWRNPLPVTRSSASLTGPSILATQSTPGTHWEAAKTERISRVEDLELRFALELSLAEAQSRESAKVKNCESEE